MMRCKNHHDSKYYVMGEFGKVPYCSKCRELNKANALPEMDRLYYMEAEG